MDIDTEIQKIRVFWKENYYIKDDDIIDVPLSCILSHILDKDPVWLVIVGPPSSLKTEFLRSLGGIENESSYVQWVPNVTKKGIISGKTTSENNPEPDLAIKMNGRITWFQDLTTIFADRTALGVILSHLRLIYDGPIGIFFPGGKKMIMVRTTILMAVTDIIDKHRIFNAQMGERMMYKRIPPLGILEEREMFEIIRKRSKTDTELREEASDLMFDLLISLFAVKNIIKENELSDKFIDYVGGDEGVKISRRLFSVSQTIGLLRSTIARDKGKVIVSSQREGARRLWNQLSIMVTCLSKVKAKKISDMEVKRSIIRLALDCIPYSRYLVFLPFLKLYKQNRNIENWKDKINYRNDKIIAFCLANFEYMHKYSIISGLEDLEAFRVIEKIYRDEKDDENGEDEDEDDKNSEDKEDKKGDIEFVEKNAIKTKKNKNVDNRFFEWRLTPKFASEHQDALDFIVESLEGGSEFIALDAYFGVDENISTKEDVDTEHGYSKVHIWVPRSILDQPKNTDKDKPNTKK